MEEAHLKKAVWQDRDLLYRWINDETVRKNSLNTRYIEYDEHINWFYGRLNKDNCDMYICYIGDNPVGQIRLDYADNNGWISYSIDSSYRGKGYGTLILSLVEEEVKRTRPQIDWLMGVVKINNIASQKKFIEMHYEKIDVTDNTEVIVYRKKIS